MAEPYTTIRRFRFLFELVGDDITICVCPCCTQIYLKLWKYCNFGRKNSRHAWQDVNTLIYERSHNDHPREQSFYRKIRTSVIGVSPPIISMINPNHSANISDHQFINELFYFFISIWVEEIRSTKRIAKWNDCNLLTFV